MKALKPYQQKIKEKYTDKNMQNRAISKLFEDAQANPLAGCVTSFAQIPIFLGLYRSVTRLAQEGRLDEPFLWIPSLQGPVTAETNYRGTEWLTQGWVDGVPPLGWETTLAFCVMPVLLVLGQSFTMNVLQPPDDESSSEEEQEQMKTKILFIINPISGIGKKGKLPALFEKYIDKDRFDFEIKTQNLSFIGFGLRFELIKVSIE